MLLISVLLQFRSSRSTLLFYSKISRKWRCYTATHSWLAHRIYYFLKCYCISISAREVIFVLKRKIALQPSETLISLFDCEMHTQLLPGTMTLLSMRELRVCTLLFHQFQVSLLPFSTVCYMHHESAAVLFSQALLTTQS